MVLVFFAAQFVAAFKVSHLGMVLAIKGADLLQAAGLRHQVDLVLAPLKPMRVQSGDSFNYYDTGEALQRLAASLSDLPTPRILTIVDGPPESTGRLARYPAVEVLLQAVPVQHGHVLLDDYRRPGEQATAQRWMEFLSGRGATPQLTEFPLEKMACLIRFDSTPTTDATPRPSPG
jgi:hypothetical protein